MSFHHPCSAQDKCLHFHPDHILLLQLLPTWNLVYSADTFVTFSFMSYRKNSSVITTFPTTMLFRGPFFLWMRLNFSFST